MQLSAKNRETLALLIEPKVLLMLALGFSAGLPLMLIFSSLSLWLIEAGVSRSAVTFFSWAAFGYSFKFVWASLVDKLPLPILTAWLGQRRGWLLFAQVLVVIAIVLMAAIDPSQENQLAYMAMAAVMLGFSSATQDIVIDAYRIEIAPVKLQAMMAATYVAGYRLGMIFTGAGVLYVAEFLGSTKEAYHFAAWSQAYLFAAALMVVGVVTTFIMKEPESLNQQQSNYSTYDYFSMILVFAGGALAFVGFFFYVGDVFDNFTRVLGESPLAWAIIKILRMVAAIGVGFGVGYALVRVGVMNKMVAKTAWVSPIRSFFERYPLKTAILILALIGFYRVSDIVLGVISNVFYADIGFTKTQIATAVKTFGIFMAIFGGFVGGLLAYRVGLMRMLMLGAILTIVTNLLFIALYYQGSNLWWMYLTIAADNLVAGIASAVFVAFLSSLTQVSFSATQYAIFSSLMLFFPKMLGGYSGGIVDNVGYPGFFLFASMIGIPVVFLVYWLSRVIQLEEKSPSQLYK